MPPGSVARRFGYACLVALGVALTGYGSIFVQGTPMIPYGLIPDLRGAILLGSGLGFGLYAAYGPSSHRTWALWSVVAFVIGFHLEEATVHWIGPYPGSITGIRVGILGTLGSLLALAGVALLHVDVESGRLAHDLDRRGAGRAQGSSVASRLRSEGARRVLALAAGVAALGALALVAEKALGNTGTGGVYILVIGAALLFGLAFALVRVGRRS